MILIGDSNVENFTESIQQKIKVMYFVCTTIHHLNLLFAITAYTNILWLHQDQQYSSLHRIQFLIETLRIQLQDENEFDRKLKQLEEVKKHRYLDTS